MPVDTAALRDKLEEYKLSDDVHTTGAISDKERDVIQKKVRSEIRTLLGL